MAMNLRHHLVQFSNLNMETILNPSTANASPNFRPERADQSGASMMMELRNTYAGHSCTCLNWFCGKLIC